MSMKIIISKLHLLLSLLGVNGLTHYGLMMLYYVIDLGFLVNIGSDIGLLPDSIKLLPEPMLNHHQWGHGIQLKAISSAI